MVLQKLLLESAVILQGVLMCLNNLLAERQCKGQYEAMFQQGICMKLKIPTGTQENPQGYVKHQKKSKEQQAGRGEDGWLKQREQMDMKTEI